MQLQQIFNLAIQQSVKIDPRGKQRIKKFLGKTRKQYQKLSAKAKKQFDKDRLTNPYPDSRILYDTGRRIKTILAGIDMESAEIMLGHFLKADLVLAHHPLGKALADLNRIMPLQADLIHSQIGVPINIAEGVLKKQIGEVKRQLAGENHYRAVDMAKQADISLICLHTITDNLAWNYIEKHLKRYELDTVKDVIKALKDIPEYQEAVKRGAGPQIIAGASANRAGKVAATEFTGGTTPGKMIYPALAQAGLGTLISMHMREPSREQAEKNHINVIIAGHIASDSLGMNLFLDQLEKKGLKIIPTSGLIRVKRS
jgi:putative NIF3 family GTP cyclohydrolase 1 type 2